MKKVWSIVIICCLLLLQLNVMYVSSAINTIGVTATIEVADTTLIAGQTTTVTFTFSEAVSGFIIGDMTVPNAELSNLTTSDGKTYMATLTPDAGVTENANVITLDNTEFTNAAGNSGEGITTSNNYAVDTERPTATIEVADTTLKAGQTTTVTITFSEAVTGFDVGDMTVPNAGLSNLTTSDGKTYTATLTPNTGVTDNTNVITLDNTGITDIAGNMGEGTTTSNNYAVDTERPTATIEVADTTLKVGQTTTVTITFSEAVTGFDVGDMTVPNAELSNLTTSDGKTYTATLTPDIGVTDNTNIITLDNTGVTNAAGNTGEGVTISNNYAVDTKRPTPQPINPAPQPSPITVAPVMENGRQLYEANISLENVQYEIQRLGEKQIMTVNFPIESSEVRAILAEAAAQLLAAKDIQWQLQHHDATILIPSASLQNVTAPVYFHLLPVAGNHLQQLQQNAEQQLSSTMLVTLLGKPVTIETNLQNRPVTLTLPIPSDAPDAQLASLFVYIEHSDGTTEVKSGRVVKLADGGRAFTFDVTHFSTFALFTSTKKEGKTLAPYIQGYGDGTFKPNNAITRAHMATMFARFLTNGDIPAAKATFEDTKDSTYKDAIEFVKKAGLFNGTTETTFNPNGNITRAQMAVVVARWVEKMCKEDASKAYCQQEQDGKTFTDVKLTHWAAAAIQKASALGIMTGMSATTFNPDGVLTRAQAVKVLNHLFERPAIEGIRKSTFSDVPASHWAIGEIEAAATDQIIKK